jgi:hypothetical protein
MLMSFHIAHIWTCGVILQRFFKLREKKIHYDSHHNFLWNDINFFPGIKRHESHCYIITSRGYVCMYRFYSVIHFH